MLAVGTPLLFALLALAAWLLTGYTLRPIAALRKGAAEVTGTGVPRALPVPPARDEVRVPRRHAERHALPAGRSPAAAAEPGLRHRRHELRSPIASIRAQLEVALDHPDGLDWAETARDVHADTLRLARLTEDLLLLARLDGQHLRHQPTDLAALCEWVTARYATAQGEVPGSMRRNVVPLESTATVVDGGGGGGGAAVVMVSTRLAVPVPPPLIAEMVDVTVPAVVGLPVIKPEPATVKPAGRPLAENVVGELVAVIWYENVVPTVPVAVSALVMTGEFGGGGGGAPVAGAATMSRPIKPQSTAHKGKRMRIARGPCRPAGGPVPGNMRRIQPDRALRGAGPGIISNPDGKRHISRRARDVDGW